MKARESVLVIALLLGAGAHAQTPSTTFTYDANGNLTGRTNLLNYVTSLQYDALNRLTKITDHNTGQTQYGYDGRDQLIQVSDPRSLVTSYTIDGLGKQTQLASPDTGSSQATFDAAGNILTRTDAKGQVTQYQYDALNRLTQTTYHDGSKDIQTWDQGTYGKGRLTQIEQKNAANATLLIIQYGYDALGRKLQETRQLAGQTYTTQYQYGSVGRLIRLTYPSGRKIDYGYDGLGRISSLTLTELNNQVSVLASNIQYHPFGSVKSLLNGAGQTLTFGMDLNGRPSTYTLGTQSWLIGYDAASRIVAQMNTADVNQSISYVYDAVDRLTQAIVPSATYGYGYDATGNRTSQISGSSSRTYTTSPSSNRLTSISGNDPKTYSYDNNGSMTGDGGLTYGYDVRGRMTSSTGLLGTTNYAIDPLGQRVRKTNSAEDSVYHYDSSGHLIGTTTSAGVTQEEIVWLGDKPLSVVRAGSTPYYIHGDHLDTPRVVTNALNQIIWRNLPLTEPFGNSPPEVDPDGNGINFTFNLRFPGQYFDKETNLAYNYFRDYDSAIGRYVQSDPIGLESGINTYGYVEANPLDLVDPLGLNSEDPLLGGSGRGSSPGIIDPSLQAQRQLAKQLDRAFKDPNLERTYQTYTRYNPKTRQCYSGRTSGFEEPEINVRNRGLQQTELNDEGFDPPVLDRSSNNRRAIRGREQQVMEINGGAQSAGGTSRNKINGISPLNPLKRYLYIPSANAEFGSPVPIGRCQCQ